MSWVTTPNLPEHHVTTVAVSAQAQSVIAALERRNIQVLRIPVSTLFAAPVAAHTDLRCWLCGDGSGLCTDEAVQVEFEKMDVHLYRTNVYKFSEYPQDCSLNAAQVGHYVFANPACICVELLQLFDRQNLTLVPVKQGYAKCSTAVVCEDAIMTADRGIAKAARQIGLDALLLEPGYVALPGYPYGFLGGVCGKLDADTLAFAGCVQRHPQADLILRFLEKHGVKAVSLYEGPLQDIGGILPVAEEQADVKGS